MRKEERESGTDELLSPFALVLSATGSGEQCPKHTVGIWRRSARPLPAPAGFGTEAGDLSPPWSTHNADQGSPIGEDAVFRKLQIGINHTAVAVQASSPGSRVIFPFSELGCRRGSA